MTLLSYAVPNMYNELILYGIAGTRMLINIGSHETPRYLYHNQLTNGQWHHLCMAWRSSDGDWKLVQDSVVFASGKHKSNYVISGGGIMIIGQEQDAFGGGFDVSQSFVGDLTAYNVWQHALTLAEIHSVMSCGYEQGDLFSWSNDLAVYDMVEITDDDAVTSCVAGTVSFDIISDVISYAIPQGHHNISWSSDFYDNTYNGSESNGLLSGGVGQLTDGVVVIGECSQVFRPDTLHAFVGWNMQQLEGELNFVFDFGFVRTFGSVDFLVPCAGFPLGMENEYIQADQLSYSSIYNDDLPTYPNLNGNQPWIADWGDSKPYLKLDLLREYIVDKIVTQGSGSYYYSSWITEYRVYYSLDDSKWDIYGKDAYEVIQANTEMYSVVEGDLSPDIRVRYLIINPISWRYLPALRFELYGCAPKTDTQSTDHTNVSGNIQGEVVWTLQGSPYIIEGAVVVGATGTLIIQPGVSVLFSTTASQLEVHGMLLAVGRPGLEIEFTSIGIPIPGPVSKWSGLHFLNGYSKLSNVEVRRASTCIRVLSADHVEMTSVSVGQCQEDGIVFEDGRSDRNVTLVDVHVSDCGGKGISFSGSQLRPYFVARNVELTENYIGMYVIGQTVVDIQGGSISSNNNDGFITKATEIDALLDDVTIEANEFSPMNICLANNTFDENSYLGSIYFWGINQVSNALLTIDILNNTFINSVNVANEACKIHNTNADVHIKGNTFSNNQNSLQITQYSSLYFPDKNMTTRLEVSNNYFAENKCVYYHGTIVQLKVYNFGIIDFSENILTGNEATLAVLSIDSTTVVIRRNVFNNSRSSYDLYTDVPFSEAQVIAVGYNYWGSPGDEYSDVRAHARTRVCDFFTDMDLGMSDLSPYYVDAEMTLFLIDTNTTGRYYTETEDGFIGGEIGSSTTVTIENSTSPYVVDRSIYIREGSSLLIERGAQIEFMENRGIYVRGNLHIVGESNNTVVFRNRDSTKWYGLWFNDSNAETNIHGLHISMSKTALKLSNSRRNTTVNDITVHQSTYGLVATITRNSQFDIHDCLFTETEGDAIDIDLSGDVTSTGIRILDSVVSNNGDYGIYIHGNAIGDIDAPSTLVLDNVKSTNNNNDAFKVNLGNMPTIINMSNSDFNSSDDGISIVIKSGQIYIEYCNCGSNFYYGCYISYGFSSETQIQNIIIKDSTFANNHYSQQFYFHINTYSAIKSASSFAFIRNRVVSTSTYYDGVYFSNLRSIQAVVLDDNVFQVSSTSLAVNLVVKDSVDELQLRDNMFINCQNALYVSVHDSDDTAVSIEGNSFISNYGDNIIQVQINPSSEKEFSIIHNNLVNNSNIVLEFLNLNSGIKLFQNFFNNPTCQYNVKLSPGNSIDYLDAAYNWWGSSDSRTIRNKIYDNSVDSTLPVVEVSPFLASQNYSDIAYEEFSFVNIDGDIGGEISSNVTLTKNGSPYHVTSNIVVKESGQLTIEPGCELLFDENTMIRAQGIIVALGTAENHINMTAYEDGLRWRGLQLVSRKGTIEYPPECGGNVTVPKDFSVKMYSPNYPANYLNNLYCIWNILTEPGYRIRITFLDFSTSYSDHVSFGHGSTTYSTTRYEGSELPPQFETNVNEAWVELTTNSYYTAKGFAVRLDAINVNESEPLPGTELFFLDVTHTTHGIDVQGAAVHMGNVSSHDSAGHGITIDTTVFPDQSNTIIRGCNVTGASANGINVILQSSIDTTYSVTISSCRITNNDGNAIYVSGSGELAVQNCSLTQCQYGFYSEMKTGNLIIDDTMVVANEYGVYLEAPYSATEKSLLVFVTHSIISESFNRYSYGSIKITDNSNYQSNVTLLERIFSETSTTMEYTLLAATITTTVVLSGQSGQVTFNYFSNPGSTCELSVGSFSNTNVVNAQYNYWGATDFNEVTRRICSFHNDMTLAHVEYLPYLSSMGSEETEDLPVNLIVYDGEAGGTLTSNVTLTQQDSPYVVTKTIFIRSEAQLIIEAGVHLQFLSGRGILCEGRLEAVGTPQQPITFSSYDDTRWYGILFMDTEFVSPESKPTEKAETKTQGVNQTIPECGGSLYIAPGNTVQIMTPNYPGNYPNNLDYPYGFALSVYLSSSQSAWEKVVIQRNTFNGNSATSCFIDSRDYADLLVSENTFQDNTNTDLTISTSYYNVFEIMISNNVFDSNSGHKTLYISTNSPGLHFPAHIVNNEFYQCTSYTSVIFTESATYDINYNFFDNPIASYDIYVSFASDDALNAEYNWWGSPLEVSVSSRIYDRTKDYELALVDYIPFLDEPIFTCFDRSNCSANGQCVQPNVCRCTSGWGGLDCSNFSCSGLSECHLNGDCIGPNQCLCHEGWSGNSCAFATCHNVNQCNGNGFCLAPDTCACVDGFTSADCSKCLPNRWGPACQYCPNCVHGNCDSNTGKCVCDGVNWDGPLCEYCAHAFYGEQCLPITMVLNIAPSRGPDVGGIVIQVTGHNFEYSNHTYRCLFGDSEGLGQWISKELILCTTPPHIEGVVTVEVSPPGEDSFTSNGVLYEYYGLCPVGACGKSDTPPHGICVFGKCSCFLPWIGDDCNDELLQPVIAAVNNTFVKEGAPYEEQLWLKEGNGPFEWSLYMAPIDMTIDKRTGMVTWSRASANIAPQQVTAGCSNIIGSDSVTWTVNVPLSYNATVDYISVLDVLPYTQQVTISGYITFLDADEYFMRGRIPVDVKILRPNNMQIIRTATDLISVGYFQTVYYPVPNEYGHFSVDARHPADGSFDGKLSWMVKGMRTSPTYVTFERYLGDTSCINIATLINDGPLPLHDIAVQVFGVGPPLDEVTVYDCGSNVVGNFANELNKTEELPICLNMTASAPLSGTLSIIFITPEGTSAQLTVWLNFEAVTPVLVALPSYLTGSVNRGSQKLFDITIQNVGQIPTTALIVDIPSEIDMTVVSFEVDGISNGTEVRILPDSSAVLVIAVTVPTDFSLGELNGRMTVSEDTVWVAVNFHILVTSSYKLDFTVAVEDEFTYFADGRPRVADAQIRLVNPQNGVSLTGMTNINGTVTFYDIHEAYYTVFASAAGHSSYSAVILASSSTPELTIFLFRVAVSYTWTVSPTTFQDSYVVTLESTFEAEIPMPVVTIEPSNIDLLPLEEGRQDKIDFIVTNHGLIAAEGVTFTLPTGHPTLEFIKLVDDLGDLAANSSIVIPVDVRLKTSRRKRDSSSCYVAPLDYFVMCGVPRTVSVVAHFIHTVLSCFTSTPTPSSPNNRGPSQISCTGCGGIGPPSTHVSPVVYNPVTPINCNCIESFVNYCIMGFAERIITCPLSIIDFGLSPSLLGLLDAAIACIGGTISLVWQVIRCVSETIINCGGDSRRKREIDVGFSQNLIDQSRVIEHYQLFANEVLGSDEMLNMTDVSWYPQFKLLVSDDSLGGQLLTIDEYVNITSSVTLENNNRELVGSFLNRWNNTVVSWDSGILEPDSENMNIISYTNVHSLGMQFRDDLEVSRQEGYADMFDQYNSALETYVDAQNSGGSGKESICATVRVRIVQELVLTREAFNARLEVENGESGSLTGIKVVIRIWRNGDPFSEEMKEHFAFSDPELIGISSVDGNGTLAASISGSAEWLIIPYSTAAPDSDILYDVGGSLSYAVGDARITVPLLADTITVKPDPQLHVHYFHEKYVQGDDPLTEDVVENIVPFTLAILISNVGYGIARELKITSAQPEIIENDKGLLVTFQIIGAQLENEDVSKSLTIDFGDIPPHSTKVARWLLSSSLQGTFSNFSATFENINPLGDPQLSIIDVLEIHELLHLVRINHPIDDGITDFLVSDMIDAQNLPDHVYSSEDGHVFDVRAVNLTLDGKIGQMYGIGDYRIAEVAVNVTDQGWLYVRVALENRIPLTDFPLVYAVFGESDVLLLEFNVWTTTHIYSQELLHIFDYNSNYTINTTVYYSAVFGPRNDNTPLFSQDRYSVVIETDIPIGYFITSVEAYDEDVGDAGMLEYSIIDPGSNLPFAIDSQSGNISLSRLLLPGDLSQFPHVFAVIAADKGLPPKGSYTVVQVSLKIYTTSHMPTTVISTTHDVTSHHTTPFTTPTPPPPTISQPTTSSHDGTSETVTTFTLSSRSTRSHLDITGHTTPHVPTSASPTPQVTTQYTLPFVSSSMSTLSINIPTTLITKARTTLPRIPTVVEVVPHKGPAQGGNTVQVRGVFFMESDNGLYHCRFGVTVAYGSWVSHELIRCSVPPQSPGIVTISVSPAGVDNFTTDSIYYEYYGVCPGSNCGTHNSPSHGVCVQGECSCFLPWIGEECNVELLPPVIAFVNDTSIKEGTPFSIQIQTVQGSGPFEWSLNMAPIGMIIDKRTGMVTWSRASANIAPQQVTASCSNIIGSDSVTWTVNVPLSYNATVDYISVLDVLPYTQQVTISGYITFLDADEYFMRGTIPVDVKILGPNNMQVIRTTTDLISVGYFQAVYYPVPSEYGHFAVDARHPADGSFDGKLSWLVKGMRTSPTYVTVERYLGDTNCINIATLINDGPLPLYDIAVQVYGVGPPLDEVTVYDCSSNILVGLFANELDQAEELPICLNMTASAPLSGTLSIMFTTQERTLAEVTVSLKFEAVTPVLVAIPSYLTGNVNRGSQKLFDITIQNVGQIPTTALIVDIPSEIDMTVVSLEVDGISNGTDVRILPDSSAVLVIAVTVPTDFSLGELNGRMTVSENTVWVAVNFHILVTSSYKLDFTVAVEDEFTYFADGRPRVADAQIRLVNPQNGVSLTGMTNINGTVIFHDLREAYYTVFASADGHSSYSAVILSSPTTPELSIFLFRVAIPMPVVTIEPSNIDLLPLEEGRQDKIDFIVTNHGLIAAEGVTFTLPTGHPTLEFIKLVDDLGDLAANSSIVIPVDVRLKTSRRKRDSSSCYVAPLDYFVMCGVPRTVSVVAHFIHTVLSCFTFPSSSSSGPSQITGLPQISCTGCGGIGPPSTHVTPVVYNPVTPINCNCIESFVNYCIIGFAERIITCPLSIIDFGLSPSLLGLLDAAIACIGGTISLVWQVIRCISETIINCGGDSRRKRDIEVGFSQNLIDQSRVIEHYHLFAKEVLGSDEILNITDVSWYSQFKLLVSDDSLGGQLLTIDEYVNITSSVTLKNNNRELVGSFLNRWNNTVVSWDSGILERENEHFDIISYSNVHTLGMQFRDNLEVSRQGGYADMFDQYNSALETYVDAQNSGDSGKESICATVRVRIVQELVLTREAFNARLEVENGESSSLTGIKVVIRIWRNGDPFAVEMKEHFAFSDPELIGISSVDGNGTLAASISGSAEWLIIPYSTAAPDSDILYDVGGSLSYAVGDARITVPLLADTITVKPDPQLHVHYFHEKYVQGDDPLTQDVVENVVPFSLAIMISNVGYGIARELKITSAQPEIIENDKGLLVTFQIIGAQLENEDVSKSLTIDFGDIPPHSTKIARWLLSSSLQGTFSNFSATFENINPLGDPQLSIIDVLEIHELSHLVKMIKSDDGFTDFLVNDLIDSNSLPDRVYSSEDGETYAVHSINCSVNDCNTHFSTLGDYRVAELDVDVPSIEWVYVRMDLANYVRLDEFPIAHALVGESTTLLLDYNVWATSHINCQQLLHIFDYNPNITSHNTTLHSTISYTVFFGPLNEHTPFFKESFYRVELPLHLPNGTVVFNIEAYDSDVGDAGALLYSLSDTGQYNPFTIDSQSGNITVIRQVLVHEFPLSFKVLVTDTGIPQKHSETNIEIHLTSETTPSIASTIFTMVANTQTPHAAATSETPVQILTTLPMTSSTTYLQQPRVLEVVPSMGPGYGGITVQVKGAMFMNVGGGAYRCRFGTIESVGTWMSDELIVCVLPSHSSGIVAVSVSPPGLEEFTDDNVLFEFYGVCPEGACGSNYSTPRGVCAQDKCSCFYPWYGDKCNTRRRNPTIVAMDDMSIIEGVTYDVTLTTSSGDQPLIWSLISGPDGILLDWSSGKLLWEDPVGSDNAYEITVKCRNDVGDDKARWNLFVQISYNVTVDSISVSRPLTSGQSDASHPSDDSFVEKMQWLVEGMTITPSRVSYERDLTDVFFHSFANIENMGHNALRNISVQVYGSGPPLDGFEVFDCNNQDDIMIHELLPDNSMELCARASATSPLVGTLDLVFSTPEGTHAYLVFDIALFTAEPTLVFSPPSIQENVQVGVQKLLEVYVYNIGETDVTNVQAVFSDESFLAVVMFTAEKSTVTDTTSIPSGQSAILMLSMVAGDGDVGEVTGSILVQSIDQTTFAEIDFNITVTQRMLFDLVIIVEDEYTYYVDENLLVTNAEIELKNPLDGTFLSAVTGNDGMATFHGVCECIYSLRATAFSHSGYSNVIRVSYKSLQIVIFLHRRALTYKWAITSNFFTDLYSMIPVIENELPMPVLTIDPATVNLHDYEIGINRRMIFTITNHGSAGAEDITLTLPTNHPTLEFVKLVDVVGDLKSKTTIIVPVEVRPRVGHRNDLLGSPCYVGQMKYSYICRVKTVINLNIYLVHSSAGCLPRYVTVSSPAVAFDLLGNAGLPGSEIRIPNVDLPPQEMHINTQIIYTPESYLIHDCEQAWITQCSVNNPPKQYSCVGSHTTSDTTTLLGRLNLVMSCMVDNAGSLFGDDLGETPGKALSAYLVRGARANQKPEEILEMLHFDLTNTTWYEDFQMAVSDSSDDNQLLTLAEYESTLAATPDDEFREVVANFLMRWNNTIYAWNNGVFERDDENEYIISYSLVNFLGDQYVADIIESQGNGFQDPFHQYAAAYDAYVQATEGEQNIFATVYVTIEQELVLTSDEFVVRLEIVNGQVSDLTGINVTIKIWQHDDPLEQDMTSHFSLGKPNLVEITSVDGNGVVKYNVSGLAEWTIVAQHSAAWNEEVLYDVGGSLSYAVGNATITATLLHNAITVKPSIQLHVHYFYKNTVYSDEPLTDAAIEKAVPFPLVVMITNKGNGVAEQFKLVSGQPQIRNENGDLINFQILSSQLGNIGRVPSLSVDVGTIDRLETRTIWWSLAATMTGTFSNFSATFQHTNAYGNPEISLLHLEETHELIHVVHMNKPGMFDDDDVGDFLVNDVKDQMSIPDHLYSSKNGEKHVVSFVPSNLSFGEDYSRSKREVNSYRYVIISIDVPNTANWTYTQVYLPVELNGYPVAFAEGDGGAELKYEYNVWTSQADHNTSLLHLLDYIQNDTSKINYTVVLGPVNRNAPAFSDGMYTVSISVNTLANTMILHTEALDDDEGDAGDYFYFIDEFNGTLPFSIDAMSGNISSTRNISELDKAVSPYTFKIAATDHGVPAKTGIAFVIVYIVDHIATTSIMATTSSAPVLPSQSISPTSISMSRAFMSTTESAIVASSGRPTQSQPALLSTPSAFVIELQSSEYTVPLSSQTTGSLSTSSSFLLSLSSDTIEEARTRTIIQSSPTQVVTPALDIHSMTSFELESSPQSMTTSFSAEVTPTHSLVTNELYPGTSVFIEPTSTSTTPIQTMVTSPTEYPTEASAPGESLFSRQLIVATIAVSLAVVLCVASAIAIFISCRRNATMSLDINDASW
uniref:Uncharacterized protein LOC100371179 n=1 Tax=Saccoglossus kowalevskii TaxID=10224 RepID=A0ABM0MSG5_SACKO|nr:PREDICTED: uncharacterized protein LOC100371179 [Saccoglossus kowalevskii]